MYNRCKKILPLSTPFGKASLKLLKNGQIALIALHLPLLHITSENTK